DDGVMLTHVRLDMLPGDKRSLHVKLPDVPNKADFWFAFVNQNGVWPSTEQGDILLPLEQQSRNGKTVPVEFFYTSRIGAPASRNLDLALVAPQFDLPLENIVWRVHLNEKWQLKKWAGSFQLQQEQILPVASAIDVQAYLQNEAGVQREKSREAEEMLAMG